MAVKPPVVNGSATNNDHNKYINSIDPEDPDYRREMMRPAEIKEDVKLMEHRKRVSLILNSEAFKAELEKIISDQLRQGGHPASLLAMQQISDLLLPHSKSGARGAFSKGNTMPTLPINDIRSVDMEHFVKGERLLRCKLTAVYRLVDFFGLTHGVYNHITVRINKEQDHFLINPFGLLYNEVTASSLIKIDRQGNVVDQGSTIMGVNRAGWLLHAAIHAARPEIRCVIHLHTPAVIAVSAMRVGLLPISPSAVLLGKISYHDYAGIVVDESEAQSIANDLGSESKVLLLRNHGVAVCGASVEEAWHLAFNLVAAAKTQISLGVLASKPEELHLLAMEKEEAGMEHKTESGHVWRTGELEFETLMRVLDNAGHRTGHIYRQPIIKPERRLQRYEDVEIPPSSSSFTYYFDGDVEHSKYQSLQKLMADRARQGLRTEWLNTPNTYHKEEIEEIGTMQPKKFTKWVVDCGEEKTPSTLTSTRLTGANSFAPIGINPKELKSKQKEVKKAYYADSKNAGPQSRVLEGMSHEQMKSLVDEGRAKQVSDNVFVVGAASKGIIQREHQHNAAVYHASFAPNPFNKVTDDDLEEYRKEVERKNNPQAYQEALLQEEARARQLAEEQIAAVAPPPASISVRISAPSGESSTDGATPRLDITVEQRQQPPRASAATSKKEESSQLLSPPAASDTMPSDTSGTETHDELQKGGDSSTAKKKKEKKKMFSFGKSDKKDKKKAATAVAK